MHTNKEAIDLIKMTLDKRMEDFPTLNSTELYFLFSLRYNYNKSIEKKSKFILSPKQFAWAQRIFESLKCPDIRINKKIVFIKKDIALAKEQINTLNYNIKEYNEELHLLQKQLKEYRKASKQKE